MVDGPAFAINEGKLPLDVPGVWEDQTIHVLRLPGEGQAVASLVITRETLSVGMEPADYAKAELERLRTTLPEFELRGRAPIAWADQPGEALLTRWRASPGLMDQITACRRGLGRAVLIFTATHPAPMPNAAYDALIAAIGGFRARQDTPEAGKINP